MNAHTKEDKLAKIQEYSRPMVSDLGKLADETKGTIGSGSDASNLAGPGTVVGSQL
jgi:hypothetical protein